MIGDISQTARLEREGALDIFLGVLHSLVIDLVEREADACTRSHTGEYQGEGLRHIAAHQILGNLLELGVYLGHVVDLISLGRVTREGIQVRTELIGVNHVVVEQTNGVGLDGTAIDTLVGNAGLEGLGILSLGVILVGHHQRTLVQALGEGHDSHILQILGVLSGIECVERLVDRVIKQTSRLGGH